MTYDFDAPVDPSTCPHHNRDAEGFCPDCAEWLTMTEQEAWTYLASCWDNPEISDSGYYGIHLECIAGSIGLCSSIETLYINNELKPRSPITITLEVRDAMRQRLEVHDPAAFNRGAYFWRLRDIEGAQSRAAFCHQSAITLDPITNTDKE